MINHVCLCAHAYLICALWIVTSTMASSFSEKKCPMCTFEARSVRIVLSHLRSVHSNDPRFNVMCGLDGCSSTFRTFSAFYSHIYRRHRSSGIVTSEKYAFRRAVALPEQCSNQLEDGMDTNTADTDHPLYDDDRVPGEFLLSWHVAWYLIIVMANNLFGCIGTELTTH